MQNGLEWDILQKMRDMPRKMKRRRGVSPKNARQPVAILVGGAPPRRLCACPSACGKFRRNRRGVMPPWALTARPVFRRIPSAFAGGNRGENVSYRVLVFRPCRNVEGVELLHFLHFYTAKDYCAVTWSRKDAPLVRPLSRGKTPISAKWLEM